MSLPGAPAGFGTGPRGVYLCSSQLGCPANLALTTQLHNFVLANGWDLEEVEAADTVVVVACSILVEYREAVRREIEYFAQRFPDKRLFVTGCFLDEDLPAAPNLVRIGMTRADEFDEHFGAAVPLRLVSPVSTDEADRELRTLGSPRAVFERPCPVLVETGCLSRCAYCVEPALFPKVKSVPLADVVSACEDGIRKGYTNFLVGGADVTSWGHDLGLDVTHLFDALFDGPFRGRPDLGVGIKALEPSRLVRHFDKLRRHFAQSRIDWIYLPLESGSDRVLRDMRRKYKVDDVLAVVRELRAAAPKLRIETDFVICYPTETAEDFEASLRLLPLFDHWNLVPFGRHAGTDAYALVDSFPPEEKARRIAIARDLMQRAAQPYRPECRNLPGARLPDFPGRPELYVLSRRLAGGP